MYKLVVYLAVGLLVAASGTAVAVKLLCHASLHMHVQSSNLKGVVNGLLAWKCFILNKHSTVVVPKGTNHFTDSGSIPAVSSLMTC